MCSMPPKIPEMNAYTGNAAHTPLRVGSVPLSGATVALSLFSPIRLGGVVTDVNARGGVLRSFRGDRLFNEGVRFSVPT